MEDFLRGGTTESKENSNPSYHAGDGAEQVFGLKTKNSKVSNLTQPRLDHA